MPYTIEQLKQAFETGRRPQQQHYHALIDLVANALDRIAALEQALPSQPEVPSFLPGEPITWGDNVYILDPDTGARITVPSDPADPWTLEGGRVAFVGQLLMSDGRALSSTGGCTAELADGTLGLTALADGGSVAIDDPQGDTTTWQRRGAWLSRTVVHSNDGTEEPTLLWRDADPDSDNLAELADEDAAVYVHLESGGTVDAASLARAMDDSGRTRAVAGTGETPSADTAAAEAWQEDGVLHLATLGGGKTVQAGAGMTLQVEYAATVTAALADGEDITLNGVWIVAAGDGDLSAAVDVQQDARLAAGRVRLETDSGVFPASDGEAVCTGGNVEAEVQGGKIQCIAALDDGDSFTYGGREHRAVALQPQTLADGQGNDLADTLDVGTTVVLRSSDGWETMQYLAPSAEDEITRAELTGKRWAAAAEWTE